MASLRHPKFQLFIAESIMSEKIINAIHLYFIDWYLNYYHFVEQQLITHQYSQHKHLPFFLQQDLLL